MRAEQLEMVLDACERTRDAQKLVMFTNLFHGFLADHKTNWTHNPFNGDILWMVIASTRGALLTGNPEFRDVARTEHSTIFPGAAGQSRRRLIKDTHGVVAAPWTSHT
jgi:hypothetical protein